jgi:hypothetical protein
MTPKALRRLQDLRRQILSPPRPAEETAPENVPAAA